MPRFGQRLLIVGLALALLAGQPAACAGWAFASEARMACCPDGVPCPLHGSDAASEESAGGAGQPDVDRCCTASAPGDDSVPPPADSVSLTAAAHPADATAVTLHTPGSRLLHRATVPPPPAHVPRHLLLCTFVV